MKKAVLALVIITYILVSSCNTERHCRPEFMSGYSDSKKMYK